MDTSLKYMDIVKWTEQQIAASAFLPGEKFLSESALGEKFGFSRQTVRRALEILEQNGHISRIQGSGTYIAEPRPEAVPKPPGKAKASMTIGIVSTYLDDYIFPGIVRGIEGVLTASGYAVQLVFTKNLVAGETRALQNMLESNLDGLIVEPTKSGLPCLNLNLYHSIRQKGIPLVFIDSYHPAFPAPCVALDDEKAGYLATQHLYSMGHRRIAGMFAVSHRQGQLRYLGHLKALSDLGLPVQDDRIFWYSKENLPEILRGQQLLQGLSECTAVVCYNDQLALKLIDLLRQNGKHVPEDISIVGIDNCELAAVCALTSIVHPLERLGEAAAKLLLSMIGGEAGESILFAPQLAVRDSVRRLPEE